jgi:hypothetical protein
MSNIGGIGAEDSLGNRNLNRVKTPRADATQEERVTELIFTGDNVGDITEWPVERKDAVRNTRVDHASKGVVPQVLLVDRARAIDLTVDWVLTDEISRMAASNSGGLHSPIRRKIGWPE